MPRKRESVEAIKVEESSIINSIAYDHRDGTLGIAFHKGTIYQFPNIKEEEWKEFKQADSKGSFFRKNFAGREFTKIRG